MTAKQWYNNAKLCDKKTNERDYEFDKYKLTIPTFQDVVAVSF